MRARPLLLATLEGLAVEGGLDGPGEPATCYGPAIHLGRCPAPGAAAGLWENYEAALDAAAGLGVDGVRFSFEWARLEPRPGHRDPVALARYRRAAAHARELGLRVGGVVVDAAWPSWLGPEAWLLPWVGPRVLEHAEWLVEALGDLLDSLVGLARPEQLVTAGYLYGAGPPWRSHAAADATSARRSLADVATALAGSASVAPLLVDRFRELPVVDSAAAMGSLLDEVGAVDEVHLRALVRGAGPSASATGLLHQVEGRWVPAVGPDVLARLR